MIVSFKISPVAKLVLFLILGFGNGVTGQTYFFDHYGVEEGIPHSRIYTIFQDSLGFVWLGMPNGVARFDGKHFELMTVSNGLAQNGVKAIALDMGNRLWLGHWGGEVSLYYDSAFHIVDSSKLYIRGDIGGFVNNVLGYNWIYTMGSGLVRLRVDKDNNFSNVSFFKGAEGLGDRISSAVKLSDGSLLCAVYGLGLRITTDGEVFKPYEVSEFCNAALVSTLGMTRKGDIIAGDVTGAVYLVSSKDKRLHLLKPGDGVTYITQVVEGWDGTIYCATWGRGLVSISETGVVKCFDFGNGLEASFLICLNSDREGNLLVGSRDEGLFVFKGNYLYAYGTENGLPGEQVWAILQHNRKVWIGTDKGVAVRDQDEGEKLFSEVAPCNKLQSGFQVRCLAASPGTIYAGTLDGGLWSVPASGGHFSPVEVVNAMLPQPALVTSLAWFAGNLWIGTAEGLYRYFPEKEQINRHTRSTGLAGNDILALAVEGTSLYVACRSRGITCIDQSLNPVETFGEGILPLSLALDDNSSLWVGTEGQGLVQFVNRNEVKRFTKTDGLLSDFIPAVEVSDKWVYVGTTFGMNRILPDSNIIETYTRRTGFTGVEVKSNAIRKMKAGRVWFGTAHGINCFNPTTPRAPWQAPATRIDQVMINLKPVSFGDQMSVSYTQNNFYFEYRSVSITCPDLLKYRYRLIGAIPEWSKPVDERFVSFPGLSPGAYRFEVQACDASGQWLGAVASVVFTIRRPFWQTPWFTMVALLVLSVFVMGFFKYRERKLKSEKLILEAKVKKRTVELMATAAQLEMKNRDITDSINYARRIQMAIMRPEKELQSMVPLSFIFYRPKDIVSGDFYWFSERKGIRMVAAADCTGHGVPGAFMSMIGISYLNEIINERKVTNPAQVLEQLRSYVISVLQQTGREGETKDGMDVALMAWDQKNNILRFAGAFNSLYLCRFGNVEPLVPNGEEEILHHPALLEIKGDKMPVGTSMRDQQPFTNHTIKVVPGDSVYLATDGFIDQFGGPHEKKFMARRFREMLLDLAGKTADVKARRVAASFDEWKGNLLQIDDVLVIGIDLEP